MNAEGSIWSWLWLSAQTHIPTQIDKNLSAGKCIFKEKVFQCAFPYVSKSRIAAIPSMWICLNIFHYNVYLSKKTFWSGVWTELKRAIVHGCSVVGTHTHSVIALIERRYKTTEIAFQMFAHKMFLIFYFLFLSFSRRRCHCSSRPIFKSLRKLFTFLQPSSSCTKLTWTYANIDLPFVHSLHCIALNHNHSSLDFYEKKKLFKI